MAAAIRLSQQHSCSLDHLVRASKQRRWHFEAKRLGRLEIDEQLNFRGLLDRQVRRFFALENAAGINADPTERFREAAAIAHQAAGRDELTKSEDRGHGVASS